MGPAWFKDQRAGRTLTPLERAVQDLYRLESDARSWLTPAATAKRCRAVAQAIEAELRRLEGRYAAIERDACMWAERAAGAEAKVRQLTRPDPKRDGHPSFAEELAKVTMMADSCYARGHRDGASAAGKETREPKRLVPRFPPDVRGAIVDETV